MRMDYDKILDEIQEKLDAMTPDELQRELSKFECGGLAFAEYYQLSTYGNVTIQQNDMSEEDMFECNIYNGFPVQHIPTKYLNNGGDK